MARFSINGKSFVAHGFCEDSERENCRSVIYKLHKTTLYLPPPCADRTLWLGLAATGEWKKCTGGFVQICVFYEPASQKNQYIQAREFGISLNEFKPHADLTANCQVLAALDEIRLCSETYNGRSADDPRCLGYARKENPGCGWCATRARRDSFIYQPSFFLSKSSFFVCHVGVT